MWHLIAQQAPEAGDWVQTFLTATGPAGVATAILWKLHSDHVKRAAGRELALREDLRACREENRSLANRLFLLADRGMAVGQTASEVATGDARDPELLRQMQRLEALLEERGGR